MMRVAALSCYFRACNSGIPDMGSRGGSKSFDQRRMIMIDSAA
jgi:hypothetical protein